MIKQPLVSVIMNCYNGEAFLRNAIDSIYAQTYKNWEIIFWDNASTDTSADIAQSYDEKIRYFKDATNKPIYEARGLAVQKAKGKYLAFLDCDDWWEPCKLEKQVPMFRNANIGFVYGSYWLENEMTGKRKIRSLTIDSPGITLDDLLKHNSIAMVTLMIRRSAYDLLDYGFDPRFSVIGDFDLLVRLAAEWESAGVHDPIAHYRWHRDNYCNTHPLKNCEELEEWYEGIKSHSVIGKSNKLYNIPIVINYAKGMFYMKNNMKGQGLEFLLKVPLFSKEAIKLIAAFILPERVLRKLSG